MELISKRRKIILLCLQSALCGAITPNIRAVFVEWDDKAILLYFIFDGEISDEDIEEASCVETEFLSSLPRNEDSTHYTTKCIRIDAPKPIPDFGRECAYKRKEP